MIAEQQKTIDKLVPLIKIIRNRQSLYFEALSFVSKNIQSTFNDYDQIYIFSKFLASAAEEETELVKDEESLLRQLGFQDEADSEPLKIDKNSKQMIRLYEKAREIFDQAIEKGSKSLFRDNGRLTIDYSRFKKSLLKIVTQNPIDLYDFAALFINFSKSKYRKQIAKLKTYLSRLQLGDQVSFRQMFAKNQNSDASSSPEEKMKLKSIRKLSKKSNQKEQCSQTESPHRRPSTKKAFHSGSKTKKNGGLKVSKKQEEKKDQKKEDVSSVIEKAPKQKKSRKQRNARQLYQYYAIMELNKKEFLEDYIFEKNKEDEKRKQLMTFLMEKNKFNDEQIRHYHSQCQSFNPVVLTQVNPSSDENQSSLAHHNESSSVASRISSRTSFIISKRKPSFTFQSPSERSEGQFNKNQLTLSKTIRNFSTRKANNSATPSPIKTSRPKNSSGSKKIFVVKPQKIFEDDVIPKAQITNNSQWVQHPLTGPRQSRPARRAEPLRLKKRNNPCPLDNNFLPESFQLTQFPV